MDGKRLDALPRALARGAERDSEWCMMGLDEVWMGAIFWVGVGRFFDGPGVFFWTRVGYF